MRQRKQANASFLETRHLLPDVKVRSARGGAATIAAQAVKFGLQLGFTAVIARLLSPRDFGLVGMAAAVTGFIMLFKDMGLSLATVQKTDITHEEVSTLFWINLGFSLSIAALAFFSAPSVSAFYGEPELAAIMGVLSAGLLLAGLATQHKAILGRQMRFGTLALLDVLSMLIGYGAALVLGYLGYGYWSLVTMNLATAATLALGVWMACGWRPGRPRFSSRVGASLKFGGNMTAYGVVNYLARSLDNILIGRYCEAAQLGYYGRAYSLLLLPIGQLVAPISSVAYPALSRLKDDPLRYQKFYFTAVMFIAYLSMPMIAVLFVLADDAITLILGRGWGIAAELFKILAITAFFQPIYCTVGWVYVSLDKTSRMMKWGLFSGVIVCLAFVAGVFWDGARGVATLYTLSMSVLLLPNFMFAFRNTPLSLRKLIRSVFNPLAFSLCLGTMLYCIQDSLRECTLPVRSMVDFAAVLIFCMLAFAAAAPLRKDYSTLLSVARLVTAKAK